MTTPRLEGFSMPPEWVPHERTWMEFPPVNDGFGDDADGDLGRYRRVWASVANTINRFEPVSLTADKYCTGQWSGNFLNWATMSRMDVLRKILFGGLRSTDTKSRPRYVATRPACRSPARSGRMLRLSAVRGVASRWT